MQAFKRYKLTEPAVQALQRDGKITSDTARRLEPILGIALSRRELVHETTRLGVDVNSPCMALIGSGADRWTGTRVWRYLKSIWTDLIAPSRFVLPARSYLLLRPGPFSAMFRSRLSFFSLVNRLTSRAETKSLSNPNAVGFQHNRKQMRQFFSGHRERTEKFAILLRCISDIDVATASTLCVGPRNEAEVLLLKLYGFDALTAIDLFSYSPLINVMDMNDIRFPDDRFDVYYSSFVLTYSPNVERTLKEALRVTRSGGIHVFGWTSPIEDDRYGLTPEGSDIKDFAAFEAILDGSIGHIFWKERYVQHDQYVHTIIYRVVK